MLKQFCSAIALILGVMLVISGASFVGLDLILAGGVFAHTVYSALGIVGALLKSVIYMSSFLFVLIASSIVYGRYYNQS